MLHDNFLSTFAVEGDRSGQHFEQQHAQSIDINFLAVDSIPNFGSHVVEGSNCLSLVRPTAGGNKLGQAVVPNFHHPRMLVAENIPRLQVSVNDALVVQVRDSRSDCGEPCLHLRLQHPSWAGLDYVS